MRNVVSVQRFIGVPLAALLAFVLLLAAPATAGEPMLTAPEAQARAEAGELLLVDVRSRKEWQADGVPAAGKAISMHENGFLEALDAALEGDRTRPVALICATGGRSNWLQGQLGKMGYTTVYDVAEGMHGSPAGPGWLKRGLPVRKAP